jgi:hypothetical protein
VRHSQGSEQRASANPQKPLQPPPVEADDHLVVYGDDRDGHAASASEQLLTSRRILRDVLGREGDAVRRKEFFRRVAGLSR